jgi:hypothetical protein
MLVTAPVRDAQGMLWPGRLARHAHWAVMEMPPDVAWRRQRVTPFSRMDRCALGDSKQGEQLESCANRRFYKHFAVFPRAAIVRQNSSLNLAKKAPRNIPESSALSTRQILGVRHASPCRHPSRGTGMAL